MKLRLLRRFRGLYCPTLVVITYMTLSRPSLLLTHRLSLAVSQAISVCLSLTHVSLTSPSTLPVYFAHRYPLMASFVPLNQLEDPSISKQEHTRELQVEQAFKGFELALSLQKKSDFVQCYQTYEDLFKIDVVSSHYDEESSYLKGLQNGGENHVIDELSFLSPNLKSLRYLIFRNRALLYLSILKSKCDIRQVVAPKSVDDFNEQDAIKEMFYTMLDDMGNALIYQEADEYLLQILYEILHFLGSKRLARYVLEYTLSGRKESEDILGFIPLDKTTVKLHRKMVNSINEGKEFSDFEDKYDFLKPLRTDFLAQIDRVLLTKSVNCKIKIKGDVIKWENITSSINNMVKSKEDKSRLEVTSRLKLRDVDPYFFSPLPMEILLFEIPKDGEDWEQADNDVVEIDKDDYMDVDEKQDNRQEQDKEGNGVTLRQNSQIPEARSLVEPTDDVEIATEDMMEDIQHGEGIEEVKETVVEVNQVQPETEQPETEQPETEQPETEQPETEQPETEQPETEQPETEQPETEQPETEQPETEQPETEQPETEQPETEQPEVQPSQPEIQRDQETLQASEEVTKVSTSKSAKAIQRASKRLQKHDILEQSWLPDIEPTSAMFVETSLFFQAMNNIFEKSSSHKLPLLFNISETFPSPQNSPQYVQDFIELLNNYDPSQHYKALADAIRLRKRRDEKSGDDGDEKLKLLDVLKSFSKSSKHPVELYPAEPKSSYESPETIMNFIAALNAKQVHLVDAKLAILKFLMDYQEDGTCLMSDVPLLEDLLYDIQEWCTQLELKVMQDSIYSLKQGTDPVKEIAFCTSLYELFVDNYVDLKSKLDGSISRNSGKGFQKSIKSSVTGLISTALRSRNILDRWEDHIESISYTLQDTNEMVVKTTIRYKWAKVYRLRADNGNFHLSNYLTTELKSIEKLVDSSNVEFNTPMPNYKCISEISPKSIQVLSNTITVVSVFAKVLYAKEDNSEEAMSILERTLIEPEYFISSAVAEVDDKAITAVKTLLDQSETSVKFSLWTILFFYYNGSLNFRRFQFGFERVVKSVINHVTDKSYTDLDGDQRFITLLRLLTLFDEYLVMFLDALSKRSWRLEQPQNPDHSLEAFKYLLQIFELVYMFSLHEEAALITARKISLTTTGKACYDIFKATIVRLVSVISIYFDLLNGSQDGPVCDNTLDLLSLIHENLGNRRLCDSGKGIFLQMNQDLLLQSRSSIRQNDILQILCCRNHWKISTGDFSPTDHDTEAATELDKNSALQISKLVLPLCLAKNPLDNPPRGDLKLAVDVFYEIIGDPEYEPLSAVDQNHKALHSYLNDTSLTSIIIRDCFYGLKTIGIQPVDDSMNGIVQNGLYYLQGLLVFSSYKIRKKSMQGRFLELEKVIKLLENDLIFGTNRVESWLLLGQTYSFLVEDDLIWTPDKLTTIEKKIVTANLQRKSILCYLMAINLTKQTNPDKVKPIIEDLMASFAIEMFDSVTAPMSMMAYRVTDKPKFLHKTDGDQFVTVRDGPTVKKSLCWKIIQQCLVVAIKSDPEDWMNYYYLLKVQRKLNKPPSIVIDTILEACESTPPIAGNDLVLETHYKLCSLVFKYVKSGQIEPRLGVDLIRRNQIFKQFEPSASDLTKKEFYNFIIDCLKKLAHIDKKKWHHKYHYRLAKIYFEEFNDPKLAIDQMSSIISLKATSKTLVLIWKPDIERPGKHFCYTSDYVLLYIDLLYADKNLVGLFAMVPRLRRSSSLIVSLLTAWEKLCSQICKLIRYLCDIKDQFTDSFLHTPIHMFFAHVKQMTESLKTEIPDNLKPVLCLLNGLNEMKKLNSGFGPTSLLDDTTVAVFIRIYYQTYTGNLASVSQESPAGKVKRLAKKDIFPCVLELLKTTKREIDAITKDKPELLNEFAETSDQKIKEKEKEVEKVKRSLTPAVDVQSMSSQATPMTIENSAQTNSDLSSLARIRTTVPASADKLSNAVGDTAKESAKESAKSSTDTVNISVGPSHVHTPVPEVNGDSASPIVITSPIVDDSTPFATPHGTPRPISPKRAAPEMVNDEKRQKVDHPPNVD